MNLPSLLAIFLNLYTKQTPPAPIMTQFSRLTEILRCPITHQPLVFVATNDIPEQLLPPGLKKSDISAGYLNSSKTYFYPIIEGIACLLPAEQSKLHDNVKMVQAFYENYGWKRDEGGRFHDSSLFIEKRKGIEEYNKVCTNRIKPFLKPQGKYLLDVASGPVFQAENQALSNHFETRICMDISLRALAEARQNLGDEKAVFIQADISNLPLQDAVCDNVMSIHTLYHVPKDLQEKAITELHRVCQANENVIILYNWAWHSWLMNVLLLPVRVIKAIKRIFRYITVKPSERWLSGGLYFYPHSPSWFKNIANKHQLKISFHVLTAIHQDFVKYYIHDKWGGARVLRFIQHAEEKYPRYLGRHGAFAILVIS